MPQPRNIDALEAAIAGVAAFLPEEVAKALQPGAQPDLSAADPDHEEPDGDEGAGGPGDGDGDEMPPAQPPEAAKSPDGTEEVQVTELDADMLFRAIRHEVAKAVADTEVRLLARFDRLDRAALAGLEVHKAVGSTLKLATRTPAATPLAPGMAASSARPSSAAAAARHGVAPRANAEGNPERPLEFAEVMKAVEDGIIEAPEATIYTNRGELPRKLTPGAIRAQLAAK